MPPENKAWLRCYRCWSSDLEVQVHYEGIHKIDPQTGERAEVVDELQEAVVQCLDCMHDQPHLGFRDGRVEPIEDRWERMIAGTPWVASCTVTVDAEDVETCSGPDAGDALSYAAFGEFGTREFFTHVRFHKHDDDKIVVHLLVELYARSLEEATQVLEEAARGPLAITSLAEESRRPRRPAGEPLADADGARLRAPGAAARLAEARLELLELVAQRAAGRSVAELREVLARPAAARPCSRLVDASAARSIRVRVDVEAVDVEVAPARHEADRRLDAPRRRRRSGGRSTPARGCSRRSRATGTCRRRPCGTS